jgi:hypothetical protein
MTVHSSRASNHMCAVENHYGIGGAGRAAIVAPRVLEAPPMLKHRRLATAALPLFALAAAALVGCAPSQPPLPEGVTVETLQTERLVLHGVAAPHPESASCSHPSSGAGTKYVQLSEGMVGNISLRPTSGIAVLHIEELASNRKWCVLSHGDARGASVSGDFPPGTYSVSVEGSQSHEQMPFQVVVERM